MSTVTELLAEIDAFLLDTGIAETTFGRHAVNDGKFVGRLREGAGITVATVDRVRAYISSERERMAAEGIQPRRPRASRPSKEAAASPPAKFPAASRKAA